jgi:hypothetical protein
VTTSWSPTLTCSRFFTSGATESGTTLPFGPFSVISRLAASTASTVATSRRFCAIDAWPGDDVTTALSSAWTGGGQRRGEDERCGRRRSGNGCFILAPWDER